MTRVQVAAGLLHIEALLMMCRAEALLDDRERFTSLLSESRAKLDELARFLLTDDSQPLTQLFLAGGDAPPETK
jgi:hypothetical protein